MWGGANKRARVKWGIITKETLEGGIGLKDLITTIDAIRVKMQQKLITRDK